MFKKIIQSVIRKRSETVVARIWPYIKTSPSIIDIGSGTGDVAYLIQQRGKKILPIDVADFHGPRMMQTNLYDGTTIPFPNQKFKTALLLMVMHHTPDPTVIFQEAARVATELVVIETSYTSKLHRFFTIIADVIGNLRLDAQWQSYKSDAGWQQFFTLHGYKVEETRQYWDRNLGVFPFLHILYYVKKL